MKQVFSIITFLIFTQTVLAQNTGTIKGQLKEEGANEAIIGATVFLKGTSYGASTDVDGNFQITAILEGTYTLSISAVGYDSKEIENIQVEAGKVLLINTTLYAESTEIGAIEVVARKETGTEISVIAEIKEAEQVAVGISSEQIQKSQDRDAAQVLRRIPGVSLQENRFAIVRGLPQRYNAVMINDIYAPSTEVDSRAFSFDLVPSNMIDRVLIFKSGAGELPGDFAGGAVKIYTKSATEENFTNVSLGYGFRTNTTLRKVQDYQGSKTDFLGFDNGFRSIPSNFPSFISNNLSSVERARISHTLNSDLSFSERAVLPDVRLSFNMGRRFKAGKWQISNLSSVNYGNTHQYYDAEFNNFQVISFPPPRSAGFKDDTYTNFYRLGVLHNWSFTKNANNRIEFKNLFNQQSFKQSLVRNGQDFINGIDNRNFSQRFEQKSFYGSQILGRHKFNNEKFLLSWVTGFNYTNKSEPDWRRFVSNRLTGKTLPDGSPAPFQLSIPGSGNLFDGRYFSKLNEFVYSGSIAVEQKFSDKEDKASLKLRYGLYTERKSRKFDARYFSYLVAPGALNENIAAIKEQPLSQIFTPANVDGVNGLTFVEGTSSVDAYDATNTLVAPYVGAYIPVGEKFSISPGLRAEYNVQAVNTLNLSGQPEGVNNPVLSILPSLNLIYNLNDKQLVRLAYSRTLNRPEFRELAPFIFYDFNLNASITGNSRLKNASIDNVDLRWEYYPSASELISGGVFYKSFNNPIENYLQNSTGGAGTNNFAYSFGNAINAQAYGLEIEIRKSFFNLSSSKFLQNLSVVANASYLISSVDVGNNVDLGPSVGVVDVDAPSNRTLVGQSPYLVNVGLYYFSEKTGWQVNALYNVAGPRLYLVGNFNNPSFYENQRHIIDFNIAKKLNSNFEVRFTMQDILNQKFRIVQDANLDGKIGKEDGDIKAFRPGTTSLFTLTYNF